MISVVIPALNEAATIRSVVDFARRGRGVAEVIVIDDGSTDGTARIARSAGARVVLSTMLGKGVSMADGLREATRDVLVFLDGDLSGLRHDLIECLAKPVLDRAADVVKAKFSRSAGRVTALTAQPLLRTFFPELAHFAQPLGGIVAARRSLLEKLEFERDYGVDIGLLIDASEHGARIGEVDIGRIEHVSHPLEALGDMARQVVRVLLDRAARYGRLTHDYILDVDETERRVRASLDATLSRIGAADRVALFDMDGVLVKDRFVVRLAERTGRTAELARWLDRDDLPAEDRTHRIGEVFRGVPRSVFEATACSMPLMDGAASAVVELKRMGWRVGVVTDSFYVTSGLVRRRVFADFSIAHVMRFERGLATGDVTLAPAMTHPRGCDRHPTCKANVLLHLDERLGIAAGRVLAVGDGENDVCLLSAAGTSVAFHPRTPFVAGAAHHVVPGALREIVRIAARANA